MNVEASVRRVVVRDVHLCRTRRYQQEGVIIVQQQRKKVGSGRKEHARSNWGYGKQMR